MVERLLVVGLVGAVVAAAWLGLRWRSGRYRRHPAADLVREGRPLVLAFFTADCVPCRTVQKPALEELRRRFPQLEVREVDATVDTALARRFGILTVPSTVLVSPGGRVVAINHGAAGWERLAAQLGLNGLGRRARMTARTAR